MLAHGLACSAGLSAMAIDEACAWSRRRTQVRAGRLTRSIDTQEISRARRAQCRWCEFSNGGTRAQGSALTRRPKPICAVEGLRPTSIRISSCRGAARTLQPRVCIGC